jgi:creatinine amidohydrolase/Fe(II)-dependent formamide hydrolase-like protein
VETRHPGVCFDPNDARFAQMGEDARTATAQRGEAAVAQLVEHLAQTLNDYLKAP